MNALSAAREEQATAWMPSVDESPVATVLARLHAQLELSVLAGTARSELPAPSPVQGRFLYILARAVGARTVVEFGCGAGVATLYLAAAVRDNWGGRVLAIEPDASRRRHAMANILDAGVAPVVELCGEDAHAVLTGLTTPVDLLRLPSWQDGYRTLFDALLTRLRPGVTVVADGSPASLAPWFARLTPSGHGVASVPLGGGLEFAVLS